MERYIEDNLGMRLIAEPILRDRSGEIGREGVMNLGLRTDFALQTEDGWQTEFLPAVEPPKRSSFEFQVGRATIHCSAFDWSELLLGITGADAADGTVLSDIVRRWAVSWMKEDEPDSNEHFCDCVHFVSDPEQCIGGTQILVDLGTAPVAALIALLEEISNLATRIILCPPEK